MNGKPEPEAEALVQYLLPREASIAMIKRASEVGDVQFHRLGDDVPKADPHLGEDKERDRLARAFDALRRLDEEVRHRAEAIFKANGLAGNGFMGTVHFSYASEQDQSGSKS